MEVAVKGAQEMVPKNSKDGPNNVPQIDQAWCQHRFESDQNRQNPTLEHKMQDV